MQLARRLEADPPCRAGDQRDLSVQVVCRHRCNSLSTSLGQRRRPRAAPRIGCSCPNSPQSTRSSPFPSSRSGCSSAGASGDVFARSLASAPRAPRSGASTRARRPPTAAPAPTTSSPASSRTSTRATARCAATGCRARPGWDCHGLPVELEVEKQLGITSKQEIEEFGIAEFNQRCRESVFTYVEEWNRLTERIGFWIDLDDPYVTLENDYIESVWWSLRQLWDEDRLYEGHKVVPYCPRCGTALSSHEVALGYQDVEDPSIYVRFPLLGDDGDAEPANRCWSGRRRPGPCPATSPSPSARTSTYVRAESTARS